MQLADCGARTGLWASERKELQKLRHDLLTAMMNNMTPVAEVGALSKFYKTLSVIKNDELTFTPEEAVASDQRALADGIKKFRPELAKGKSFAL